MTKVSPYCYCGEPATYTWEGEPICRRCRAWASIERSQLKGWGRNPFMKEPKGPKEEDGDRDDE